MLQVIEEVQYYRDDQVENIDHFKAVHQRFRLDKLHCGIIDLDGFNLMLQEKDKGFYLMFHQAPKETLQQIWNLLNQVTIVMYMKVPISKGESIIDEKKYKPPKFAEDIRRLANRKQKEEKGE